MEYHIFNIGLPATTAWWQQNLDREVITAGFDAETGDRGDQVLNDMAEGDWVLAYCNGHGFVGAGRVRAPGTYKLLETLPPSSLSDHMHQRGVDWIYAVEDVSDALPSAEAGRHAPRQTKERERNAEAAERLVEQLRERSTRELSTVAGSGARYWRAAEAVRAIGHPCSMGEIRAWLDERYPGTTHHNIRYDVCLLTVNDANRVHYDSARASFRSDQGHPRDVLYREGTLRNTRHQIYDPAVHGVFDIARVGQTFEVRKVDGASGTRPIYWNVLDAVRAIGHPCSTGEIEAWLSKHHPGVSNTRAADHACLLSVNDANRRHHDHGRKDFRSDRGNAKDALFRRGVRKGVTYELYDVETHGVWDLVHNSNGKVEAAQLQLSAADTALAEARQHLSSEVVPPISSDHDARAWEMRAVAMREGQGEFRQGLLDAYDRKCAITGCAVVEILEAAHIVPYRGDHTHRTDNGLLLRADIHTLFDKGMVWIDGDGFVQIDERLATSGDYARLRGKKLGYPADPACHPHKGHLAHHRVKAARQPS
jgi:hypothetical protein